MERTDYQDKFELHYNALLGMFRHAIAKFADELVEIAARAVAIFAPLPNAINMYNVAYRDLEYSQVAAFAFAITLEIVVFLLVEVALRLWDGYLTNRERFHYPLYVAVGVVMVATAVVMSIVYWLEPYKIMALLPIVSLCSFVGIGLKRWDEQYKIGKVKPVRRSVKSVQNAVQVDKNKRTKKDETLSKMIVHYGENPLFSHREMADLVGVSKSTVANYLDELGQRGIVHINGQGVEVLRDL